MSKFNGIGGYYYFPSYADKSMMHVIWSDGEVWFVGFRENWIGAPLLPIAMTSNYISACKIVEGLLFVIDKTPEFNPKGA